MHHLFINHLQWSNCMNKNILMKLNFFQQFKMRIALIHLLILGVASQIISIKLGTIEPNQITHYQWTIREPYFKDLNNLKFYLEPTALFLDGCTVAINGQILSERSCYGYQFTVYRSTYTDVATIIVTDVLNPPNEMESTNFYYQNEFNRQTVRYLTPIQYMYEKDNEKKNMFFVGSLTSVGWIVGVILIFFFCRKECYQPYFIIFFTSLFQYIIFIINTFCRDTTLLYLGEQWQTETSKILIVLYSVGGFMIARNLCYIIYFMIYVRPFIYRHNWWNWVFCNFTVIIATLTSFEVGYLPYSKAFSFPYIPVRAEAELDPMHKLSIVNLIFINITLVVVSIIGAVKSKLGGNNFLLFADLAIVTLINSLVTLFFLIKQKPQSYYMRHHQGVTDKTQVEFNSRRIGDSSLMQLTGFKQSISMKSHEQAFKRMVLSIDF